MVIGVLHDLLSQTTQKEALQAVCAMHGMQQLQYIVQVRLPIIMIQFPMYILPCVQILYSDVHVQSASRVKDCKNVK